MTWRNSRQSQGGQRQSACVLQGASTLANGGSRSDDVVHHQDGMAGQPCGIRNRDPPCQPMGTIPAATHLNGLGSDGVHDQSWFHTGSQALTLQGLDQGQKDRLQMNPPPPSYGGGRRGSRNHQNCLRRLGSTQRVDQPGQGWSQIGHDLAQGPVQGSVVMVLPGQNDPPDRTAIWSAGQGQTCGIGRRRHRERPEKQRSATGA